jgi:predicted dehydrogenase
MTTGSLTKIGVVGLNYWGPNLVRNFNDIADLSWLCDLDEQHLNSVASRYPNAKATTRFEDLLEDDELDAVVIATPVPTHYGLAKQALEAGKHVFVEKPPAMRAVEMEDLVSLASEKDLVLMPGHLLLYHPGVLKVKELIEQGELGDVLCVYGNRVNLGIVRSNENALWSLGVHDLSVILYFLDEDPELATAQGSASIHPGVEDVVFCFLRFPSGKIAHMHLSWLDPHKMRKMTVVGDEKMVVFDDMEPERKVTVYEKRAGAAGELYSGDISIPKISTDEPLRLECTYFLELIDGQHDKSKVARDGARVVRALEMLTNSLNGG